MVCGKLLGAAEGDRAWLLAWCISTATGPAADQKLLPDLIYALAADGASRWVELSVDTAVEPLYAGFMNLQVPPELEAKLTRLAAETGRTADQVAIDLLASSVDHDEWFRDEVETGRASAREGRLIEHDDVVARMDQRYRG